MLKDFLCLPCPCFEIWVLEGFGRYWKALAGIRNVSGSLWRYFSGFLAHVKGCMFFFRSGGTNGMPPRCWEYHLSLRGYLDVYVYICKNI